MKKYQIHIIVIIMAVFLLSTTSSAEFNAAYEVSIAKGVSRMNNSDYAAAAGIFRDMLKTFPDDPKIMLVLGISLSRID
jgi:Flp pilus assembly protein TadD